MAGGDGGTIAKAGESPRRLVRLSGLPHHFSGYHEGIPQVVALALSLCCSIAPPVPTKTVTNITENMTGALIAKTGYSCALLTSVPPSPFAKATQNIQIQFQRHRDRWRRARPGSLILQHDDVVSGPPGKQRSDQLRGHGLVALRTRIPLQAVGERMCVGGHRGAGRGEWFSDGHSSSCGFFAALI